jgi:hypothetical protein
MPYTPCHLRDFHRRNGCWDGERSPSKKVAARFLAEGSSGEHGNLDSRRQIAKLAEYCGPKAHNIGGNILLLHNSENAKAYPNPPLPGDGVAADRSRFPMQHLHLYGLDRAKYPRVRNRPDLAVRRNTPNHDLLTEPGAGAKPH